jgi:hypothetical protein
MKTAKTNNDQPTGDIELCNPPQLQYNQCMSLILKIQQAICFLEQNGYKVTHKSKRKKSEQTSK